MNRATPRRLAPLLLLLLAMGGCEDEQDALAEEIEINRAVWTSQRPDRYRMVLEQRCFCGLEAVGPVEMEVQGGVVVSRSYVDTGEPVDPAFHDAFPPIAGLFDILSDAVADGADQVDVSWDLVTGVPVEFFIDYQVNTVDEERGYVVREGPEDISEEGSGG